MIRRLRHLLLFLILLLLPSQLGLHFWPSWSFLSGLPLDYLSPVLYFTDLLIGAYLVLVRPRVRLPVLLLILIVLNLLFSQSPLVSLYKYLRLLFYFAFYRSLVTDQVSPKLILRGLLVTLLWTAVLVSQQFLRQSSLSGLLYWLGERPLSINLSGVAKTNLYLPGLLDTGLILRPPGTFGHPNALAGYVLLISTLFTSLPTKAVSYFLILFTLSKTALLGVWVQLFWSRRRLLLLGLVILLVYLNLFWTTPTVQQRLHQFQLGIIQLAANPWTGVGLGASPIFGGVTGQPLHNLFLLSAVELGLPLSFLLVLYLYRFYQALSPSPQASFSFIAVMLTGLSDHYWLTSSQNLLLLFVVVAYFKIRANDFSTARNLL